MRIKLFTMNLFIRKKISIIFTSFKKIDMKIYLSICYVVVNLLVKIKKTYMYRRNTEYITIAVMMAKRTHLYPFRTQKLSSFTPKVLAENCREDR